MSEESDRKDAGPKPAPTPKAAPAPEPKPVHKAPAPSRVDLQRAKEADRRAIDEGLELGRQVLRVVPVRDMKDVDNVVRDSDRKGKDDKV